MVLVQVKHNICLGSVWVGFYKTFRLCLILEKFDKKCKINKTERKSRRKEKNERNKE